MSQSLESQLQKIGLNANESKVYLASLKLGPATAQQIAAKALVSRPNTYIMIESLTKKGIMSHHMRGKKRYFTAGAPRQLLFVIEQQRAKLAEQEEAAKAIVDALGATAKKADASSVTVYEGLESTRVVWEDLKQNDGLVRELVPLETVRKDIPAQGKGDYRNRHAKQFPIRTLSVGKDIEQAVAKKGVERRFIESSKFPVKSEVLIYGNKVVVSNGDANTLSVHIADKDIAATLAAMFDRIWESAK